MKGIAVEIPLVKELDRSARVLCPSIAISQRRIHGEGSDAKGEKQSDECSADLWPALQSQGGDPVGAKVKNLAQCHDGEIEGGQVVVQEQLTGHKVEGEVMEGPAEDGRAQLVVKSFEGDIVVIVESALPS